MTPEEAEKRVNLAVSQLGEHFECVQVLVSWDSGGGDTADVFCGRGNFYARLGMAHDFIRRDDERTRHQVVKRDEEDAGT